MERDTGDPQPDDAIVLATAIGDLARELARTVPAPRGAPFYGLDMDIRTPALLDEFCRHGIFRKYERVLMVGSGLGGAARWWSVRFGCNVIGVDPRPGLASGAALLSRRAGLHRQTQFVSGVPLALPLRDAWLTHAWIAWQDNSDSAFILNEVFRVLRPGGTVGGAVADAESGVVADRLEQMRAAGFIGVRAWEAPSVEPPHSHLTALRLLDVYVARAPAARGGPLRELAEALNSTLRSGPPLTQMFGERPSVGGDT